MPTTDRRHSPANHDRIMQMIEETDAPKDKAILMILLQISNDLAHNTTATENISKEFSAHKELFDTHVVEEQTLLNQGKGLYRAMSWMLGVASVLVLAVLSMGGYILKDYRDDILEGERSVREMSHRLTTIEENVRLLRKDFDYQHRK